jgi:hypothetical protein
MQQIVQTIITPVNKITKIFLQLLIIGPLTCSRDGDHLHRGLAGGFTGALTDRGG